MRRAEEVVGRKSEFIKGIPNTYYDEESPPPEPAGCFEDLDGYTHRAEDWSPYARDVEAADRLESMEAAERLGSKPAPRTRRAPAPITPSLRSRAAAEAEAREAEAESARAKLASARAKPRRSSVDVRDVRLDEYEESLATRVRSLQRARFRTRRTISPRWCAASTRTSSARRARWRRSKPPPSPSSCVDARPRAKDSARGSANSRRDEASAAGRGARNTPRSVSRRTSRYSR